MGVGAVSGCDVWWAIASECYVHIGLRPKRVRYLSRGHPELHQLGGFSGVGAIVPSFVPTECSGGRVCGVYSESP